MKQARYGMAPEGYDWYDMLRQYKEFKDTYNRNPKSSGASKEECRLYYWMYNQTRLIMNGNMSIEHIEALLEAGVDIPNKGNRDDSYNRNVKNAIIKKPGKGSLYSWIVLQSHDYNEGKMLPWRIRIWESYDAIEFLETFGTKNQKWIKTLEEYAPILLNSGCTEDYVKASKWLNVQVKAFDTGELSVWKKRYIENSGLKLVKRSIPSNPKRTSAWHKHYADYKRFLEENGRKPKASRCRSSEEIALRYWAYSEIDAIRKGSRSVLEIKALEKIGIVA